MEDNNENKYTGEYGNPVEGNADSQSSVYSYSYKDNPQEATKSGDYHAETDQNASYNKEPEFTQSTTTQNTTTQNTTSQNTEYQQNNGPFYQQPGGQPGGQNQGGQPKPPKKPMNPLVKKLLTCAGCAVLFGVVAAVCFQAVYYFSNKKLGLQNSNANIGYTTDNASYAKASTGAAIGAGDVSRIAENTMPSIVAITSTTQAQNYYNLFGQQVQGQESTSCGSGFIVGKNGTELLIATNNHVIEGAKTISVQFIDEQIYKATVKGTDASADLAVVAVKLADIKSSSLKKIKIAKLGDSAEVKVGEMAVAIGNALGYGQSVTVGYISAKDRTITESSEDNSNSNSGNKIKVLQTDAAINPGNSGGALLNMRGEVIGINSAKIASSDVEGVGYAIPISEATPIIDELMNKEVLKDSEKGYLGISGKTVDSSMEAYNMPVGVYVAEIAKGGACEKGGVKKGDIITAINGTTVTTIESLKEKANSYKVGTTVTLTVKRSSDGTYKEQKIKVELQGPSSIKNLPDATQTPSDNSESNGNDGSGNNGDSGDGYDGFGGNSDGGLGDFFGFGN